jgi:4-hydroxy-tetrahydrodipicolinate reductase
LKIAILGYGKMGKAIEKMALSKGYKVVVKIDSEPDWEEFDEDLGRADVAIEFSMPETAVQNIKRCFGKNIPVVTGTTGWKNYESEIKQLCLKKQQAIFIAANFSIGVNVFFEVNKKLASLMNRQGQYEISIEETHHVQKIDKPSGTAIRLAEDIISQHKQLKQWAGDETNKDDTLEVRSFRKGQVTGTHVVRYISDNDILEIKHEALNRNGFAQGALMAAEWIIGRKGVFGMSDLMGI